MTQIQLKIHITGMGGQGIIATSRLIATAAKIAGLSVMTTEIHGLAQRGGIIVSDLSIGYDPTESPLSSYGEADILIALEPLEALRSLPKLRKNGLAVINTAQYQPLPVRISKGEVKYPSLEEIKAEIEKQTPNVILVNADDDARALGLSRAMNVILLGALMTNTTILTFSQEDMIESIKTNLPPKYHETNLKAFKKGLDYKI
ncbi:MAG: indolepyruvate oxidoreductase subunit beta [Candidatus Hermodarchaeota archaeon]